jgi:hypothetical protein
MEGATALSWLSGEERLKTNMNRRRERKERRPYRKLSAKLRLVQPFENANARIALTGSARVGRSKSTG